MIKRRYILLYFIILSFLGCPHSNTLDFNYLRLKNRCEGAFRLEAGDVISVQVWNEPNHSRDAVLVRPDGSISLPLIGDINAAGLTIYQLSLSVEQKIKTFVPNPRVDISLNTARSYQIYIMGEVRNPGVFSPQAQVNVVQALSLAGGFTAFAQKDNITLIWKNTNGEIRIPINYNELLEGKRIEQNVILCRGDTLLVP